MKKAIKLRLKRNKWWLYLMPGVYRWLRQCEKILNQPENLAKMDKLACERLNDLVVLG